jgi:hypothetical protein
MVAVAVLKTGSSATAVIAAVLGLDARADLGVEVTLFALGGVCFVLALTLFVAASMMGVPSERDAGVSASAGGLAGRRLNRGPLG